MINANPQSLLTGNRFDYISKSGPPSLSALFIKFLLYVTMNNNIWNKGHLCVVFFGSHIV